jgi:hypothetical protein
MGNNQLLLLPVLSDTMNNLLFHAGNTRDTDLRIGEFRVEKVEQVEFRESLFPLLHT